LTRGKGKRQSPRSRSEGLEISDFQQAAGYSHLSIKVPPKQHLSPRANNLRPERPPTGRSRRPIRVPATVNQSINVQGPNRQEVQFNEFIQTRFASCMQSIEWHFPEETTTCVLQALYGNIQSSDATFSFSVAQSLVLYQLTGLTN